MKYRWGFLDADDNFSACEPKVDDSTALDFAREGNEIFYRGKLNGSLSFRFEFDAIIALGYNYEHRIVLQWYDAQNDEWKNVWMGRFALTDCEIDYDTKTITVQPTPLDKYTKILDALENEYNLVKLECGTQPINILIRPCYQIYIAGNTRISNFVGGNSWDADCDSAAPLTLERILYFTPLRNVAWFTLTYTTGVYAGKYAVYYARFNMSAEPSFTTLDFPFDGRVYNSDGTYTEDTLQCRLELNIGQKWEFYITDGNNNVVLRVFYNLLDDNYGDNYFAYQEGSMIEDSYFSWDRIYGRAICRSDLATVTIGGTTYTLNDFPTTDIAATSKNYNKILTIAATDITPDIDVEEEPTGWPQTTNGWYFVKPADTLTRHYWPIGAESWKCVSYWWYPTALNTQIEELLTATQTIRDAYDLRYAIRRLLEKAGWDGEYFISGIMGGTQDYAGFRFLPVITPKSNIISSFYDTPAQNAPITLQNILVMLKAAYRIYWHIDSNNNVHFEHISYYDNGMQYSEGAPDVLVDLETELHTNTKKNKVFGQNKVKFDKNDMPEQYLFGWMDKQTRPYDGFPIKCLDAYVQKGQTDEQTAGNFSVDVDMILSSPNEFSKDGFVLIALPSSGENSYYNTLQLEAFTITDDNGDTYNVIIQNADAAFVKIHENMWRFALPCENVNINNEITTAITTGRFKVQNVEFADSVMAEILKDIDNCNKVIRTQQGDGHIKTLSINLNSLVAKGDLLFNFVGRWYYLKGTALGASITIFVNGESTTIEVSNNKFTYRYKEPISTLTFGAADVVFVDFADCDNLDNLTSCNSMFDGCEELLAVDFGNKTFGAVTSANNMFRGCVALTSLICPDSSTWKADLDFSDCPALTLESFYDLIKFLYYYNAGVHTITPNSTMWNALDGDIQNDLIAKATERGWTINIPAQYSVTGESTSSTVYATINGTAVEIPVTGGVWQYDYNAAITSISFENDSNLTKIDFSFSDGLAGLTTLADAFKNCSALTSVDFSNCDLSNVASATDTFAGCTSLTELIVPAGTWKPDIDLSDTSMVYADMLSTIGILYTYATGVHTITFNQTTWDALSVAQQQTIFDAAQLKYWTTNAVAVVYYIRGKSTAASETFIITFIDDDAANPSAAETITCAVDGNGNWEYSYQNKKIYSLYRTFLNNTTITAIEITEDCSKTNTIYQAFNGMANLLTLSLQNATFAVLETATSAFASLPSLASLDLGNITFAELKTAQTMFYACKAATIDLSNATFDKLTIAQDMFTNVDADIDLTATTFPLLQNAQQMFYNCKASTITFNGNTTFANLVNCGSMFYSCSNITTLDLHNATFASAGTAFSLFNRCTNLTNLDLSSATFANVTTAANMFLLTEKIKNIDLSAATFASCANISGMFNACYLLENVDLSAATFSSATNAENMFYNDAKLTTINWHTNLNFANLQSMGGSGMFYGCKLLTNTYFQKVFRVNLTSLTNARAMMQGCTSLTSLDLSNQTFAALTNADNMFTGCTALQSLDCSIATFGELTTAQNMLQTCSALTSLNMNSATFAKLTNARLMFNVLTNLQTLSLPNATFALVTNAFGIFSQFNNAQLTTIYIPLATFESITTTANANFFNGNYGNSVVNWTSAANGIGVTFDFHAPTLNYTSFVNVANWLKDMTGLSTQTITVRAVAWNALSSAEQTTIMGIVNGKNWNLATA